RSRPNPPRYRPRLFRWKSTVLLQSRQSHQVRAVYGGVGAERRRSAAGSGTFEGVAVPQHPVPPERNGPYRGSQDDEGPTRPVPAARRSPAESTTFDRISP